MRDLDKELIPLGFDRVRVRIAPSPTGDPHVGTAYVALFCYAFAKKRGGDFVLRIEDTDRARAREGSERQIYDSLRWLGLVWDEGPDAGGDYGPYRQSERSEIYAKHAQELIEKGEAYRCFCTPARLQEVREGQRARGERTGYDRHCRDLDPATVEGNLADEVPHVVRLKMPTAGETIIKEHLRGEIAIDNGQIDDQVLLKSDGFPTYHLANVVDDHLMKISHVIRAEEWISSTPKHIQLYKAFGWEEPTWVHLPLLRNSDRSKISKRKNPTSLSYYRRAGILPQAMVNFLALMGWSYGDDIEIFDLKSMIEKFELADINLGGPIFDQTKLSWINQHYIKEMDSAAFVDHLRNEVFSEDYLKALHPLVQERFERFDQFIDKHAFFFSGALDYSQLALLPKGKEKKDLRKMLKELVEKMDELYEWNPQTLDQLTKTHKDELGWKPKDYFMTVRLIATGRKDSPPLAESLAALGRDIVRFRIRDCLANCAELK